MDDKISIIMSTYNTNIEYLNKSILSILNQTYQNIEFIIVCDGNKEEYNYIKKTFDDERIKLILHEKNEKLPKSLNEAIKISTGKYIARMDSDDIAIPNRLEIEKKYLEKNKNIKIVSMYAKTFGNKNSIKGVILNKSNEIKAQLIFVNCIIHPTVMMEAKYLKENNILYNEEYPFSQDFELWTRIINDENCKVIPKVGILYRTHNEQVSISKSAIQNELRNKIIIRNLQNNDFVNDKKILNLFYILSENIKMNKENYKSIYKDIKYFLNTLKTKKDKKTFKKVMYDKYFEILAFEKIDLFYLIKICNIDNFIFSMKKLYFKIYNKIIEKKYLNNI